ncbi:MAG: NAD(+) synthase [Clostridia bacterium]|nr:NAD(+) synthase [Clostridia bacterium]
MRYGFVKAAAAVPAIRVADCDHNAGEIIRLAREADARGVRLLVFPELCLTGYTCGDLFMQSQLLCGALSALGAVADGTRELDMGIVVGLPFAYAGKLYNCAAVLHKGALLGLVPKRHIPNYGEFYEKRHFASGRSIGAEASPLGYPVRFGEGQLFVCAGMREFAFAVELCEDLWSPAPPSAALCAAGATIVVNLSASNETVGKAKYRRSLVTSASGRCCCGYVYADAGEGESTTDTVFSGHSMIAQNGVILAENAPFGENLIVADIDVSRLARECARLNAFDEAPEGFSVREFDMQLLPCILERRPSPHPFVPDDDGQRASRCELILRIQAEGLKARLAAARAHGAVIGVSGGLDSTLALLVTARAFDLLKLDRARITAVTMPCFGTTDRTKRNAAALCAELGASLREIDITAAVTQHLRDIRHSGAHDAAYENAQARERTQVLMDIANIENALVIGTGDMSELALGWTTYNGDHMSMYGVNCSVPKTLVRHLVRYVALNSAQALRDTLLDILDTPVSPELLPPEDGRMSQLTEDIVGPYELHDFFLYYIVRWGFTPEKTLALACAAFDGAYDEACVRKWLKVFCTRFFSQQFKRSCSPDGPKVGSVSLSPRGDWRMPSDASPALWLKWCED